MYPSNGTVDKIIYLVGKSGDMEPSSKDRLPAQYPEWHNTPLYLTKEEMENPHKVLAEFFDCYNLKDIRACLREWLYDVLRPDEVLQMNYLTVHDHVIKLAEASWILHSDKTPKSVRGKKKKKNK
ncbi:MAG TPA: hypothetical protein VGQ09_20085 [Chitinophagaceae bacterium]|jgi:hypothetical protein|nr:hypothetical protein [Chitinophagaceae bacterium]